MKQILSLCDFTGVWSAPYQENGYTVHRVDIKDGKDVRLLEYCKDLKIHGILAAPPCTHLAGSGARWWAEKGEDALTSALAIADACVRAVALYNPAWWALENPVGRLSKFYGPAKFSFHPYEFAGYSNEDEAYTKKTLLWGNFTEPTKNPVEPIHGSKMHRLPPSADRATLRSTTPTGFARAWFEANP